MNNELKALTKFYMPGAYDAQGNQIQCVKLSDVEKLWNSRPSDVKMSEARARELTKEHGFESDNLTHNAFVLYESDVVKLLMEHGKEKV